MNTSLYKDIKKAMKSDDLVEKNLRLVVHFANKYKNMGIDIDDLINEGTIGLCIARDKYDEDKGKFSSYASLWIKAMIIDALNKNGTTIRLPRHKKSDENTKLPYTTELDSSYQGSYEPAFDEIIDDDYQKQKIHDLIDNLIPRHQNMIKLRFGIGCTEMTNAEIAKKLGVTVQTVNYNINTALQKLKSMEM